MKLVLDIDEVCCDLLSGLEKIYPEFKKSEQTVYELPGYVDFPTLYKDLPFWISLPVLDKPEMEVCCYITHRPFPVYVTEFWLHINKFPRGKVIHVNHSIEKIAILKELQCDLYVDDKPDTFYRCQEAGISVVLYTQKYNQNINTKHRINSLKEIICKP